MLDHEFDVERYSVTHERARGPARRGPAVGSRRRNKSLTKPAPNGNRTASMKFDSTTFKREEEHPPPARTKLECFQATTRDIIFNISQIWWQFRGIFRFGRFPREDRERTLVETASLP